MSKPSCMGGFCARREKCARHETDDRSNPHERLCEPGVNDAFEPVGRKEGVWEQIRYFDSSPHQRTEAIA